MAMLINLCLSVFFASMLTARITVGAAEDELVCRRTCGNISVPYPFGLGDAEHCSVNTHFQLTCNDTSNPPTLLLGKNLPLFNLSIENATAVVGLYMPFTCYNESGIWDQFDQNATLGWSPFLFSTLNKFMAIGCDTIAFFGDAQSEKFVSGCVSVCDSTDSFTQELSSCEGIGCCQMQVPKGLKTLHVSLGSFSNHSDQLFTNPCSYGFLADPTWYKDVANFTLADYPAKHESSWVLLDWAIRENGTSEDNDICGQNTKSANSTNGDGYLCSCQEGFEGNPYTKRGCLDIDECSEPQKYACNWKCKNYPGNYTCTCPFGKQGDGKVGCSLSKASIIGIGIGAGSFLASIFVFLYWFHKRKLQEMNHRRNGGLLADNLSVKIFKENQLTKATNNFDAKNLLGEGGNGWVYRGSLLDMTHIAVKKSKRVEKDQIEHFLNEAEIVSNINHKNVVKLLGVCLDSNVPMLVYEFIQNGTLYQHLHGKNLRILDSWRICLRVAADTARALDYMHSLARPPIIHRDVKSSNILLDGTYTAKVADFGASKLNRMDRAIAPTQGQGTMGYLDPEYLQTGELTTMSDVYSFGVVLMELLSKQKPISQGTSGEMVGLVKIFTSAIENNHFDQILKVAEVSDQETDQVHLVAELAIRCVAMPSTKRPTMTEVVDVLNGLSKEYNSFPIEENGDEIVGLLDDQDVLTTSVHFELEYSK